MRIAITGGTGFVGRNVARKLAQEGHEVVLIARGFDNTDSTIRTERRILYFSAGLDNANKLAEAFAGCETVIHCAGINRQAGLQTFHKVHVGGTQNVTIAGRLAGVRKVILISFLRARPNCGSLYHESKWQAEEILRNSGLDYTILKCGVIYGRGDHMLDHLSHAFYTFPVFAFVGFRDKPIRPIAIEDIARIVGRSATEGILSRKTVSVTGPEKLTLRQAVRRVSAIVGKTPLMFQMPLWFHYLFAWCIEKIMTVPMVSVAQIRMLSEGLAEPLPPCDSLPPDIAPRIPFSDEQIRRGLPEPGPFNQRDIRCCFKRREPLHTRRAFLELP